MVSQNHQQHLLKSKDKISFTVRDYKADIRKDAAEKMKELEKAMTKGHKMSVIYNETRRIFKLDTENTSYLIGISRKDMLGMYIMENI